MTDTNAEILAFAALETRLLNERRFRDWLALYGDDSFYWIPAVVDQESPYSNMSLLHEDRQVMEARVLRLESTQAWSNEPMVRAVRLLSDLRVLSAAADEWETAGNFLMVQSRVFSVRPPQQQLFAGEIRLRIKRVGGQLLIASKRVNLLNPEGATVAVPEPI